MYIIYTCLNKLYKLKKIIYQPVRLHEILVNFKSSGFKIYIKICTWLAI